MSKYGMDKRAKAEKESGKKSVFNWSKAGKDVAFFKPVEGEVNRFDIVPYITKSGKHPLVKTGYLSVGDPDYSLEYWVHQAIGPSKRPVVCPKRMYGELCPICEAGNRFKDDGDDQSAKACWPKLRTIYNVKTKDGKMQVFDVSDFLFGKKFKAAQAVENDEDITFLAADVESGKTVKFQAVHVKKDGMEFTEYEGIGFSDRKKPITDEDVENAISFDDCLIVYSYDEIETIFEGGSVSDDEEEKPTKSKPSLDDEDEDEKPKEKATKQDGDKPKCFGDAEQFNEKEECEDCPHFRACGKAAK